MKALAAKLPTDGPDHTITVGRRDIILVQVQFQANKTRLVCSTGANVAIGHGFTRL